MLRPLLFALAVLLGLTGTARAAESFDNCTGFIDTVPASVTTQGVWCLRHHVGTTISGGSAIIVSANNVTIDCNGFKLGGLAGGSSTVATGVWSYSNNVTVRNCQIRGFHDGIRLAGNGNVVEHNRIDDSTVRGIYTTGKGDVIRDNVVNDTGGRPGAGGHYAEAIVAFGDSARVLDNSISRIVPVGTGNDRSSYGIRLFSKGGLARNNRIYGLYFSGAGESVGIQLGTRATARSNSLIQPIGFSTGIRGHGEATNGCIDNALMNHATPLENCKDIGNFAL